MTCFLKLIFEHFGLLFLDSSPYVGVASRPKRGNEAIQDQAGRGGVEPSGHGPGENVQFNVAPNDPFLGIPDVPPLIHVGNFKERDPPVFRGLPQEDVMEWSIQFQRVSAFNQWGPIQQLRHIEFSLEGVAAKWLSGLQPRPGTYDELMRALQAAFRHHNYADGTRISTAFQKTVTG
ncbi:hypothetical protein DAPPUDRAFT_250567 [Daphnia pulex]|uniref:Retrotransposon gag domain-containing protein n=1 Tax=Daphnia pulex TaxID=6669 RepID=E9GYU7_DAPPU|nr:hypothetical protein DAPPUDRAFT_250567 [Daphnia pulex]|eukprot:EFX75220.1 hypothetical protein DAPPUDRAFT_250567 [Daphnia pulex]